MAKKLANQMESWFIRWRSRDGSFPAYETRRGIRGAFYYKNMSLVREEHSESPR